MRYVIFGINWVLETILVARMMVQEWSESNDSVLYVSAGVIKILSPIIGFLFVALAVSVIL